MTGVAGVRALFRLDGAPVNSRDAVALGLSASSPSGSAQIQGDDPLASNPVQIERRGDAFTLLMGHIDEATTLAARLRLGDAMAPAALALAAFVTFGDDLPREMLGAWVLVDWCATRRRLTIVTSINPTYTVLVARRGAQLAVSPELAELARLAWVDPAPDPLSLAASLTSYRMDTAASRPTILRQVIALSPGRVARFDATQEEIIKIDPRLPTARWSGSFDEAVSAAEAMIRTIVREHLARAPALGITLSGGLDSSILAWSAVQERDPHRTIPLMCSGVSSASGLVDEVPFARIVADHLGEPFWPVVPPDLSPYRPRISDFRSSIRPTRLPFLHLNRAFGETAAAIGLSHLAYGVMGEMTITSPRLTSSGLDRLKSAVRPARSWLFARDSREIWPEAAFATWLAPDLLEQLPDGWIESRRRPKECASSRQPGAAWGYPPTIAQLLDREVHDLVPGRIRPLEPLTDIRLLRLFAGMPIDFASQSGVDRAMARALLRGKLPERIRLRPKGPAFAPDFHVRLRRHAGAAAARIPLFRRAGIGAWLDLDRLETRLRATDTIDRGHAVSVFRTQFGVQMAEYLLWWLSGRPDNMEQIT
jgi:hypothetical protein